MDTWLQESLKLILLNRQPELTGGSLVCITHPSGCIWWLFRFVSRGNKAWLNLMATPDFAYQMCPLCCTIKMDFRNSEIWWLIEHFQHVFPNQFDVFLFRISLFYFKRKHVLNIILENSRKLYVSDLANDVHCNILPKALMNTVSSYEAAYWLEQISYNFLIWYNRNSTWTVVENIYFQK